MAFYCPNFRHNRFQEKIITHSFRFKVANQLKMSVVRGRDEIFVWSGPVEFTINPGENYYYQLTFEPRQEIQYNSSLSLVNQTEGTRQSYVLQGHGTEPKTQAKLLFNDAKCYQRHQGQIDLPCLSKKRRVRFEGRVVHIVRSYSMLHTAVAWFNR